MTTIQKHVGVYGSTIETDNVPVVSLSIQDTAKLLLQQLKSWFKRTSMNQQRHDKLKISTWIILLI